MRLLVVRNDKLGDFMLAWPAIALLKQRQPTLHITVLVPAYTAPMAELCPWIDDILIDRPNDGPFQLATTLRNGRFDALLTLFSTGRIGLAGCLAGIPYRLAPATKLAQLCYNRRLTQRRSRSEKPEYAYNIDLATRLLGDLFNDRKPVAIQSPNDFLPEEIERPLLRLSERACVETPSIRDELGLPEQGRLVFIHPGSGGSAATLRPDQYATVANRIAREGVVFVVAAGPGEQQQAQAVIDGINAPVRLFQPADLLAYCCALQHAALFVSGSTGPLHIAAALNCPTAAFYPRRRSATPLRWQTINAPERRLAFVPPEGADEKDVQAIDIVAAAAAIGRLLEEVV